MESRTTDNQNAKFTAGGNRGGKHKLIKCATLVIFVGFVVSISTYYAKTGKRSNAEPVKDSQGTIVYFIFQSIDYNLSYSKELKSFPDITVIISPIKDLKIVFIFKTIIIN